MRDAAARARVVAISGLLAAISILLTRFLGVTLPISGALALRLSFGPLPIMMAGLALGPLAGGAVGAVADLVGYFLNPMGGAYFPGFTISSALTGVIPGLLRGRLPAQPSWVQVLLLVLATEAVVSLLMNTYFLVLITGLSWPVLLPPRLAARVVIVPIYTLVLWRSLVLLRSWVLGTAPATADAKGGGK